VADGWYWFVLREEYCWLVAGGWFILREKYCWLVADKPSEQAVDCKVPVVASSHSLSGGVLIAVIGVELCLMFVGGDACVFVNVWV
jgi:hypothetical protein